MPIFAHRGREVRILDPELSIFLSAEQISIGDHSRIDGIVKLEGGQGLQIGAHVHIASFCHLNAGGGQLVIGDHSGTASHVTICSGLPDLDYWHISAADAEQNLRPLRKRTVIGSHVVIFAGAVICPGITIGDGAVIGAGSVVARDVPAMAVVAGVPARHLRWRERQELVDMPPEPAMRLFRS